MLLSELIKTLQSLKQYGDREVVLRVFDDEDVEYHSKQFEVTMFGDHLEDAVVSLKEIL